MKFRWGKTQRGFPVVYFDDLYGGAYGNSIQLSSLATQEAIWLGTKVDRMHLSRAQVAKLIPVLQGFVDTGTLEKPKRKRKEKAIGKA